MTPELHVEYWRGVEDAMNWADAMVAESGVDEDVALGLVNMFHDQAQALLARRLAATAVVGRGPQDHYPRLQFPTPPSAPDASAAGGARPQS